MKELTDLLQKLRDKQMSYRNVAIDAESNAKISRAQAAVARDTADELEDIIKEQTNVPK